MPRQMALARSPSTLTLSLHAELQRNVWFLCEADDVAALAMMMEPHAVPVGALRDSMWSGAMRQLGGEHEHLARFPGDHTIVWQHMEQLWTRQSEELLRRIDALGERGGAGGEGGAGDPDRDGPQISRD